MRNATCCNPVLLGGILMIMGWTLSCSSGDQAAVRPPNIVIILADDLGYGDLGCYNPNSLVPTPHLDQLAAEGIRLTRAYCPVSVCSPSRYALMTGRYPWRSWKKSGVMRNYEPSMMDSALVTLPEMLQQQGYNTAGFGKWHLGTTFPTLDGELPAGYGKFYAEDNGANLDLDQPVSDGPLDHGFDHWYGFSCASECWILADSMVGGAIGHEKYTIEAAPKSDQLKVIPLQDYLPEITRRSIRYLESRAEQAAEHPFFLYFAPYVPHIPLTVSPEFRGLTQAGLYGDYVHELDHYIGQLLAGLDRLGLKENTLVLFASDNGSQFKLTSSELDMSQASNSPGDELPDTALTHRHHPNWPLRGNKWSIHEGGVRTPFIARWPEHFPRATTSDQLLALNDIWATLAAVTAYPVGETDAIDSYNLLPALRGEPISGREEVIVQSSGKQFGIIQGKWKYAGISNKKAPEDQTGSLYDLSRDEGEKFNRYDEHPEIGRRLHKRLLEMVGPEVFE